MNFIKYSKIYFIFSFILISASLICLFVFGLKYSIEFTGGSILEVKYAQTVPDIENIEQSLSEFELGNIIIQPSNDNVALIRMKLIDEETHQSILKKLKQDNELEEQRFEFIGPMIGEELKEKTKLLIILSLLVIVGYVSFAFRKIKTSAKSWQYGIATLIALGHDVLIPLGIFACLGRYCGVEISIPIVVALLTVLGYSVNNTVVVFDRVRENSFIFPASSFEEIINSSLKQTIVRSVNTSLTTLFVLFAIFFFGGESLKYFSLTMIIGIIAGTYSSIFLASPILAKWVKYKQTKK